MIPLQPRVPYLPEQHMGTQCGEYVSGSGLMSYRCTRPLGHFAGSDPEPHYTPEVQRTVHAWQEWEYRRRQRADEVLAEAKAYVATARGGEPATEAGEPVEVPPLVEDTAFLPEAHTDGARGEPTKNREGDQVLPTGDESIEDDQALLIRDIEERRQVGIERYGQGHRPFNGRDTLLDLYEEQLDFLVYLRSLRRSAEADRETLLREVTRALDEKTTISSAQEIEHLTPWAAAEIAVDRVMGWVAMERAQALAGVPDEILESLIVDGIHEAIHNGATWGEAASQIVDKIRRERA